jgi:hypothetical protein
MRYAAVYKANSEPLEQFVKRKGGINACAARFSRGLGEVGQRGQGGVGDEDDQ